MQDRERHTSPRCCNDQYVKVTFKNCNYPKTGQVRVGLVHESSAPHYVIITGVHKGLS